MMANTRAEIADMDKTGAGKVHRHWAGIPTFRDYQESADNSKDCDRDIDEEHGAPPEVLQEKSPGNRTETDAQPGDTCPNTNGPAAFFSWEDVGKNRQRGRHDEGAANAHQCAGSDELCGGLRKRRKEARQTE